MLLKTGVSAGVGWAALPQKALECSFYCPPLVVLSVSGLEMCPSSLLYIFMVTWSVPALCVSVQAPISQAGCQLLNYPSQDYKHLSALAVSPLSY